jgi:hypothetical protein
MRKILTLGILVVLASASAASAATVLSLDGFCNAYKVKKSGGGYAVRDVGCTSAYGGGLRANIKGTGQNLIIALTDPAAGGTQFQFTFSYPYKSGGTWNLYSTTDGVTFNLLVSGTYSSGAPAHMGLKSATAR